MDDVLESPSPFHAMRPGSRQLKAYLAVEADYNVKLSYLAPYTPTQNTMVERRCGMAAPASRAMLHTSQLPPSYWEFAMMTTCYPNNRSYHSGADGIPIVLLTGQTSNLSHLRIFGCPAYVHIPASQRRKRDDTTIAGVMVGYSTETYGFLVYNSATRRVVTTRHVRFDETFNGRLSEEGTSLHRLSTQPPV